MTFGIIDMLTFISADIRQMLFFGGNFCGRNKCIISDKRHHFIYFIKLRPFRFKSPTRTVNRGD